jgi:hypothetical protein
LEPSSYQLWHICAIRSEIDEYKVLTKKEYIANSNCMHYILESNYIDDNSVSYLVL